MRYKCKTILTASLFILNTLRHTKYAVYFTNAWEVYLRHSGKLCWFSSSFLFYGSSYLDTTMTSSNYPIAA